MRRASPAGVVGLGPAGGAQMRLHVGDHVGAAARVQRCASATTVANRPHKPRFGSSNTADSPCQFRVPPMRPFPAEPHGHATTSSFGTCEMPRRNDLRPGSGVLRRPAAGRAPAEDHPATNSHNRRFVPEGTSARTNSRLDNQDLATGRQGGTSSIGCPMPVYAAAARGIKARQRRLPAPMAAVWEPLVMPAGPAPFRRHCGPASRSSRCGWRFRRSAARPCSASRGSRRTLFLIRARRATFAGDSTNLAPTTPGATPLTRLRSAGRSRYGTPPAKAASGSSTSTSSPWCRLG